MTDILVHTITTETSCDQRKTTPTIHTVPLKITFCHIVPSQPTFMLYVLQKLYEY